MPEGHRGALGTVSRLGTPCHVVHQLPLAPQSRPTGECGEQLTEAGAMGQLGPGVQLKAAPEGAQQLVAQRDQGVGMHDARTHEGRLQ